MDSKRNEKERLRTAYLKQREAMEPSDVERKSDRIYQRLIHSEPYQKADIIHCYVSMKHKNEVRTEPILKQILADGKRLVVPRMLDEGKLAHKEIPSLDVLKVNQWGVGEPITGEDMDTGELELIIVPMVAGDRSRNRLGYGKGFYDRFLRDVQAKKVGLLYDFQVHPTPLATEAHDIPLDVLVTENEQM